MDLTLQEAGDTQLSDVRTISYGAPERWGTIISSTMALTRMCGEAILARNAREVIHGK
jgi:hypothetical protein